MRASANLMASLYGWKVSGRSMLSMKAFLSFAWNRGAVSFAWFLYDAWLALVRYPLGLS